MFIDGPFSETLEDAFYKRRAAFLTKLFGASSRQYEEEVVPQLRKIKAIPKGSKIYLWFEYDLFCQVNLWSCCRWIARYCKEVNLHWVTPGHQDWGGFGQLDTVALRALVEEEATTPISETMVEEYSTNLAVYQNQDYTELEEYLEQETLSEHSSKVLTAQLGRLSKDGERSDLEKKVANYLEEEGVDFGKVFSRFSKEEGIYGLGDLQFKLIYDRIV